MTAKLLLRETADGIYQLGEVEMADESSQQAAPTGTPEIGRTVSQHAGAVVSSPSTGIEAFPNPMQKETAGARDWEESYKGLSRRYNEDRAAWEATVQERTQQVTSLDAKFQELEKKLMGLPQQQPEPKKQPPAQAPQDTGTQDYLDAMAQNDAIRFRDKLLFEYIAKEPDLGLAAFRENIPVVAPTVGESGGVDDSGQRGAIENLINSLKGIGQKQAQATQKAMTEGWTAGVSPTAPSTQTWEDKVNEYYKVKEQYGSATLDSLGKDEQAKVAQQYYKLHEEVGKHLSGQSTPWMDASELAESIRQIQGRVGHLEGFSRLQS